MAPSANRRSGHSRRAQYTTFFGYLVGVAGLLVGAALLLISIFQPDFLSGARSAAVDATSPPGALVSAGRSGGHDGLSAIAGYFKAMGNYARLERELEEARTRLAESEATAAENRRLKQLLGLASGETRPVAIARFTASTASGSRRFATISAGRRDGVTTGMPVRSVLGLVGRVLLAWAALRVLSRRTLLRMFQIPALVVVPVLFWWISTQLTNADSLPWIKAGIFVAGLLTVAQFSFWGNYIPHVFPTHLRGTGESFAANIGGRVLGTAAAWLTLTFSAATPPDPMRIAVVGAVVAGLYALVGVILTQWLPEPDADLTEDRLPPVNVRGQR